MRILVVGVGRGSWEVRGRQLGAAIGARVTSSPTVADWKWADLCVIVKRGFESFAKTAARFGVPIVWDAVDFWQQPEENQTSVEDAPALARRCMGGITPALIIGATQAMAKALGGVYLPHHSRPGLVPTPPRETVKTVAYEGTKKYLGRWHGWLTEACEQRGWSFVVNPPNLAEADIIVAFRDGRWDGPICREWKSGVKVVNAMAAGRPIVGQSTAAISELRPACEIVESPHVQLNAAFDALAPRAARERVFTDPLAGVAKEYTLSAVAARYREILSAVRVAA